jgi:hypothetical protein
LNDNSNGELFTRECNSQQTILSNSSGHLWFSINKELATVEIIRELLGLVKETGDKVKKTLSPTNWLYVQAT